MENSDVFASSTAPLTWHDFLERMRQPAATDFVKAIKSFIVSFLNSAPDPERDSASVQDFLGNMEAAFRVHPLWAGCSEEELESAGEGLEKYVMTKLFTRVFASVPEDVKVDDQLHEKNALVQQFIRPENLDIKPNFQNETSWLLAQKELQKINMYKAPRDKLVCILNCCKVINNLLLNASIASNESPPGADEFLPVLIYVTIKANPPQLHSNLLYIQRYRRQSRLVAEAAYYFTNMLSAESFILNLDAKAISMDESDYERNMESAQALLSGLFADSGEVPGQSDEDVGFGSRTDPVESKQAQKKYQESSLRLQPSVEISGTKIRAEDQLSLNKVQSISDLENKGATMLLKEQKVSHIFQDFPYFYAQAGDLTISDVEDLLNHYKQLVFKYVCLSKGLGITDQSHPMFNKKGQNHVKAEGVKETEDTEEIKPKNSEHKDLHKMADNSGGLLSSEIENSDSKLSVDEAIPSQGEESNDISNR